MLKFGFRKLEQEKEKPLFNFPYLIVGSKPNIAGKVCKFWLKEARDLLKFDLRENKLSWLYDESKGDNAFYLINVSDVADSVSPLINVNLGLDFNCKPLYEMMEKKLTLDPDKPNFFQLVETDPIENLPTVKLLAIAFPDEAENWKEEEVDEDEFEEVEYLK